MSNMQPLISIDVSKQTVSEGQDWEVYNRNFATQYMFADCIHRAAISVLFGFEMCTLVFNDEQHRIYDSITRPFKSPAILWFQNCVEYQKKFNIKVLPPSTSLPPLVIGLAHKHCRLAVQQKANDFSLALADDLKHNDFFMLQPDLRLLIHIFNFNFLYNNF